MTYSNVFYFKRIAAIGGTEQFLYEIAKKYNDYDITIMYDIADENQIYRLRKLVRCIPHIKGKKIKCKKAFFNFNADAFDDIEAERTFVSHAIYQELGYIPPLEKDFDNYIGVSQYACDKLVECAKKHFNKDIHPIRCYNPLTLEPKEKVPIIVSAGRLDDKTKGGNRQITLINALDRYANLHNRHYLWLAFANIPKLDIDSPNVVLMKPRIDVRPYIAMADFIVQVSNNMETYCYTNQEGLGYKVRIVTTPMTINEELKVPKEANIILEWDCSNVDEVARQIFENEYIPFEYEPPKDIWNEILVLDKSNYKEELKMKVEIKCITKFWDIEEQKDRYPEETWIVNRQRADYLCNDRQLCEEIRVIREEKKETATPKTKKEKAIK